MGDDMETLIEALVVVGPFAVLTACIFVSGFVCGALWLAIKDNKKSDDVYGDLALKLGVSREVLKRAVYGRLCP